MQIGITTTFHYAQKGCKRYYRLNWDVGEHLIIMYISSQHSAVVQDCVIFYCYVVNRLSNSNILHFINDVSKKLLLSLK